ncbi:MAG: UDP-N-acetylglucosamine 2-epimerase (non-hydrolyzing) [Kiritimatiellae bacterium]|nr:UDP-N-acetylglucosamine 2-epimerase (non-hydrolyzing) [Kiritimatiellia bacterium]MDW8459481.1 UDP-N-acetylglucosamine 2-epimerase (non-hydrolyzing) [Verrucomicrobiota bacterium]
MKTVALLAGARPNYMKIFPIWREIHANRRERWIPLIIHTGQHYDPIMNDVFFADLGLPQPDHYLGIGSAPHGAQTGRTMIALEELFMRERPDWLVVVGDVNSTLAGALVAAKMRIPLAHVEAGLRSFDRSMPEEINRLVTDAVSDLLFTHSPEADENLLREGIPPEKIIRVGNVMIDSLVLLIEKAADSPILGKLGLLPGRYILVTLHRPSNVDDPGQLRLLMSALDQTARQMPVVMPLHPRTRRMLDRIEFRPATDDFFLIDALGYLDFLRLESAAALVVTDSGGVQEETTFLGVPCLTVRPNTERPITISRGTNELYEPAREPLEHAIRRALERPRFRPNIEGWDGRTAGRIMDVLDQIA